MHVCGPLNLWTHVDRERALNTVTSPSAFLLWPILSPVCFVSKLGYNVKHQMDVSEVEQECVKQEPVDFCPEAIKVSYKKSKTMTRWVIRLPC